MKTDELMTSEIKTALEARFEPKRWLEFVQACREAGIRCLPTQVIEKQELSESTYCSTDSKRRRYWAGHSNEGVYWFSWPNDLGSLTHLNGGRDVDADEMPRCDECNCSEAKPDSGD